MSQNLQNFATFQKLQQDDLVDFEKCCKNAYLVAKIGADTAENQRKIAKNLPEIGDYPTGPDPYPVGRGQQGLEGRRLAERQRRQRGRGERPLSWAANTG